MLGDLRYFFYSGVKVNLLSFVFDDIDMNFLY